ncbi:MAG TPA: hypothetical protein VN803_06155 [Gemmatimonadales bacterium]|nr:hypothetical protein [Gemmatimonadales bacterium]
MIVLDAHPWLRAMLSTHAERITELSVRLGASLIAIPGGFADTADIDQTRLLARQLIEAVLHAIQQQGDCHV